MSSRLVAADGGFGLIEVMVSMVLLSALALTTFAVIDQSTANSAQGRSRSVAANLAHADLNRLRQLQFNTASNFSQVTNPAPIEGISYQVTSKATWTTDDGATEQCATPGSSGSPGTAYLHISSSVTWPAMGKAKPVTADSILVPRATEIDRSAGSLIFTVQDRDAAPVPGVLVSAAGQTATTSNAGCVFFPSMPAGPISAGFSKAGYVDKTNHGPGSVPLSIVLGKTTTATVSFDKPSTYSPVTFLGEDGTRNHTWATATMISQDTSSTVFPATGTTFSAGSVFPFASGYAFYAGNCPGNDPATYISNTNILPNQSVVATPGQPTTTAVAYLRSFPVSVTGATATNTLKVYIRPSMTGTGCATTNPSGGTLLGQPLKAADAGGKSNDASVNTVYIPYGTYSICVENATPITSRNNDYRAGSATFTNVPGSPDAQLKTGVTHSPAAATVAISKQTQDKCS
ncbi:MAG TPA: prepilin-type N-terminal cleavage/methylation domain-containing protein [Baekduia sp.]|jgi:prepilin-type N-terminal cleavage/methylation domain-containing protein